MCRWIAYQGSPIFLEDLLLKPEHSLIDQSRRARDPGDLDQPSAGDPAFYMNGDGVGVGWYGERTTPGVYRDILPAWNDKNLENLAEQIRSGLFLAHIRASSGGAIQKTNCHPFRHRRWLLQHNGQINEFPRLKRAMDLEIAPELYPLMEGTTDSERLFFLALTLGLADDPPRALHCMVERVEALAKAHHVPAPLIMTLALSDGERIFAVRYSSQGNDSPTLYHTRNVHAIREVDGQSERLPDDAVIVLSEPIDDVSAHWENIPERTLLEIENGAITQLPFHPA